MSHIFNVSKKIEEKEQKNISLKVETFLNIKYYLY